MNKIPIISWWKTYRLQSIVFITGAAVLVIEITATRILSPFYGNTIYTVSSVISVILAALSVGYWQGGKRADAKPTFHEFYKIIFYGGVSLLVLFGLAITILPTASDLFSIKTGPLLWSLILFFTPGYLLGMLSPFAIKLGHELNPHMGLGTMSGNIFFWSTAGSIVGSLLAGFVLIPSIGINAILFGTTALVALLGGLGLITTSSGVARTNNIVKLIIILFILTTMFVLVTRSATLDSRVQYMKDGVYEKLTVIDSTHAGRPARFFLQDKSGSGAMFLDGDDLAFDYTKYYALYKLTQPDLTNALVIGGGIYSIPKAIHAERPDAIIDVAEIEPDLESIARSFFSLPDTPNIRTHIMDGRRFLSESKETYDVIFSDVYYSLYSIPSQFTTKEFFQLAKSHLSPQGIFIANVIGSGAVTEESLIFSEIRTMSQVFPFLYVFAVDKAESTQVQNFIIVGMAEQLSPTLIERMNTSSDEFLKNLPNHLFSLTQIPLESYTLLTDDYAPVDHLVTRFLNQTYASNNSDFRGDVALMEIQNIVSLGSRAIGTPGNTVLEQIILKRMQRLQIPATSQQWTHETILGDRVPLSNIIARWNPDAKRRIILGTHYDSISKAYRDPINPDALMPGANNSASGVALLLELARIFSGNNTVPEFGIDFIFFDGEEGDIAMGEGDANWRPIGSTYFSNTLSTYYKETPPELAIIFDMICDKDLVLKKDKQSLKSAPKAVNQFWDIGHVIHSSAFPSSARANVSDDHTPLIAAGIPSMLVIDFEYSSYNTQGDTPDKCSAESLNTVGNTALTFLRQIK